MHVKNTNEYMKTAFRYSITASTGTTSIGGLDEKVEVIKTVIVKAPPFAFTSKILLYKTSFIVYHDIFFNNVLYHYRL